MGQQYCSNCRRITEQLVEGETGRWGSDPSIPLPTVGCMAWEFERLYVCVECSATSSTGSVREAAGVVPQTASG